MCNRVSMLYHSQQDSPILLLALIPNVTTEKDELIISHVIAL